MVCLRKAEADGTRRSWLRRAAECMGLDGG